MSIFSEDDPQAFSLVEQISARMTLGRGCDSVERLVDVAATACVAPQAGAGGEP